MYHSQIALLQLDMAVAQFEGGTSRNIELSPLNSPYFSPIETTLKPLLMSVPNVPINRVHVAYGTRTPDMMKVDTTCAIRGDAPKLAQKYQTCQFGNALYLCDTTKQANKPDPEIKVVHDNNTMPGGENSLSVVVTKDTSKITNVFGGPTDVLFGQRGYFINFRLAQDISQEYIHELASFIALIGQRPNSAVRGGIFDLEGKIAPFAFSFMDDEDVVVAHDSSGKGNVLTGTEKFEQLAHLMVEANNHLKGSQRPLINISASFVV
ncbi:MAG: hypothetical protein V1922_01645 [bacterium]